MTFGEVRQCELLQKHHWVLTVRDVIATGGVELEMDQTETVAGHEDEPDWLVSV